MIIYMKSEQTRTQHTGEREKERGGNKWLLLLQEFLLL